MSRNLFKPGQSGNPAGRKPGLPDKRTTMAREAAERLGCDPFEVLILFAKGDWQALGYDKDVIDPYLRARCASDAVEYMLPKLKSVEHTAKNQSDSLTPEQRLEMLKAATKALEEQLERPRDIGNGSGDSEPTGV